MNNVHQLLRDLCRKARRSIVDPRTQTILISEAKRRIRRDQPKLLQEVSDLVERAHEEDYQCIQPILKRCYLRGQYRDHEQIRYFLKAHITTWPYESVRVVLREDKNTLEFDANNTRRIPSIKFPLLPERTLPLVSDIMEMVEQGEGATTSTTKSDIEALPLQEERLYVERDQRLNDMLTKVLKLYKFLRSTTFLHSRNLGSPIVRFPLTVLGDDVSECRQRNIIKKKIAFIRNVFTSIPPLEYRDSKHLTKLLDGYHLEKSVNNKVRREYKKFLRRTYCIDRDFNISLNKYAYAQVKDTSNDVYFQRAP